MCVKVYGYSNAVEIGRPQKVKKDQGQIAPVVPKKASGKVGTKKEDKNGCHIF